MLRVKQKGPDRCLARLHNPWPMRARAGELPGRAHAGRRARGRRHGDRGRPAGALCQQVRAADRRLPCRVACAGGHLTSVVGAWRAYPATHGVPGVGLLRGCAGVAARAVHGSTHCTAIQLVLCMAAPIALQHCPCARPSVCQETWLMPHLEVVSQTDLTAWAPHTDLLLYNHITVSKLPALSSFTLTIKAKATLTSARQFAAALQLCGSEPRALRATKHDLM